MKRMQLYKRIVLALLAINVISAALGIATFVTYLSSRQKLAQSNEELTSHLNLLDEVNDHLIHLVGIAKSNDPESQFQRRRITEQLAPTLKTLGQNNILLASSLTKIEKANLTVDSEAALREVHQARIRLASQLNEIAKKSMDLHQHLFLVGLITVALGIVLPLLIIYLITRRINETRKALQVQVSHWVSQWLAINQTFGSRFYQQPEFWIQIVLLTTELFGEKLKHPLMQFIVEIASMIRQDLLRHRNKGNESPSTTRAA